MTRSVSMAVLTCLVLALGAPARAETPARRAPAKASSSSATAASAKSPAAPAASAKSPAAASAPAVPLAAPAPAVPPAVAAPAPDEAAMATLSPGFSAAVLLGPEFVNEETALKLRVDLERDLLPLAPRVVLSSVVSVGVMHWGDKTAATLANVTTTVEASLDRFELVPSLRARLALAPRLSLHGEAGLGATFTLSSGKTSSSVPGIPALKTSDSYAGMVLRFALGGAFDVSDRLRIGAEVLGLNFHYGEGHGRSVTVLAAASYRL